MGKQFRIGDRVIGMRQFDGNSKIIGVKGTVVSGYSMDWGQPGVVGVVYDKRVGGHTGDSTWYCACQHGYGWNTGVNAIRYIGRRVNPNTIPGCRVRVLEVPLGTTITYSFPFTADWTAVYITTTTDHTL